MADTLPPVALIAATATVAPADHDITPDLLADTPTVAPLDRVRDALAVLLDGEDDAGLALALHAHHSSCAAALATIANNLAAPAAKRDRAYLAGLAHLEKANAYQSVYHDLFHRRAVVGVVS